MVKVAEIKLADAELAQLIPFFLERTDKFHQRENFYTDYFDDSIDHPTQYDKTYSIGNFGWGIYSGDQKYIGRIRFYKNNRTCILTIECDEEKDPLAVLEFAKFLRMELANSGFSVEKFRDLTGDQDAISEIDQSIYTPVEQDEIELPKKPETLEKWKAVYEEILAYREEAQYSEELFVPKQEDYRDRLMEVMRVEYSIRTIAKIIKAGDGGLLT